ncbi:probable metabolite transport protein CsbC isoform X1 [Thrips palmi]|uniref:Probable metabolite transport protein CsbC isoform X1 n=1 Tax=Thrips palmi TaxID=161013 RepID=A0A6P8ZW21_THRPL|nr:probable metabolite transport protein CsbC isoform X1 [Thrips palmi]
MLTHKDAETAAAMAVTDKGRAEETPASSEGAEAPRPSPRAAAGAAGVPWPSVGCQCLSAAALMCQTLAQGMAQGWSSPGVSKLMHGEGPFVPTAEERTWIVSLFELGLLPGSVVSWAVFTRLGRPYTLSVAPLAFLVWVLLTYFASSAGHLYAARLLAGTGMGVNFTFSSIYLGEMATPVMRSVLILVMTLLAPSGQLLAFVIGPQLTYWQEALSPLPLIAASLLLHLFCTRESPFFLAMEGRHEDAEAVLFKLRRGHEPAAVREEMAKIRRSVQRQMEEAQSWRDTLSPPGVKRAALIVMVLSGSPALFGVTTVLSFTQSIFEEAGAPIPKVASMLVIGVKVVMIVVSMYLVERLGRRVQLSATAIINFIAMVAMSGYFFVKEHLTVDLGPAKWVPLVALMAFMAATGGGVIPVSHVLQGELLSQRAKMIVAPLSAVLLSATSFGTQQAFGALGKIGEYFIPFGVFALTNLFIAVFTILVVPETRGRTLVRVQDELRERALSSTASRQQLVEHGQHEQDQDGTLAEREHAAGSA